MGQGKVSNRKLRRAAIFWMWSNKPIKALEVVMSCRPWGKKKALRYLRSLPPKPQMKRAVVKEIKEDE